MDTIEIKTSFLNKAQINKTTNTTQTVKSNQKSKIGLYLMIAVGFLMLGGKNG